MEGVVEIKGECERSHPVDGEHRPKATAVSKWVDLSPDRLRYEL